VLTGHEEDKVAHGAHGPGPPPDGLLRQRSQQAHEETDPRDPSPPIAGPIDVQIESPGRWPRGRGSSQVHLTVTVGHPWPRGTCQVLFHRCCDTYVPDTRTFNTLLLRFKEVGHAQALDLFYHDVVLCGFMPNAMSYCVRMDAYYKKGWFLYALQMLDEMRSSNDDG
jgi:pentatricopeptide repeat protein